LTDTFRGWFSASLGGVNYLLSAVYECKANLQNDRTSVHSHGSPVDLTGLRDALPLDLSQLRHKGELPNGW
jgi:hypothetical protein